MSGFFDNMSVFVYAIYSPTSDQIYVGISEDVTNRLNDHNKGKAKFTQSYRPWILFYTEEYQTYAEAREREKKLKNATGKLFLRQKLADFYSGNT